MNPTELQMATYIDTMCDKLWPECPPGAPPPPRTEEDKMETRERAHHLINSKCKRRLHELSEEMIGYYCLMIRVTFVFYVLSPDSNYLILKKTDVESVFNLFQDSEENKTLVYVSIH